MGRQSLRGLTVATMTAITLGSPAPAAAGVTPVNACADLTKAGETYILTAHITLPGPWHVLRGARRPHHARPQRAHHHRSRGGVRRAGWHLGQQPSAHIDGREERQRHGLRVRALAPAEHA